MPARHIDFKDVTKTRFRPLICDGSGFPSVSSQVRHLLGELSEQKLSDWEIDFFQIIRRGPLGRD